MPDTKAVGVAYSDPALTAGTTITGAAITSSTIASSTLTGATLDATSRIASNLFTGYVETTSSATIATAAGDTDVFLIADAAGVLTAVRFSGSNNLTASDSNYITWAITNLGTGGGGSTAMLAATDANTTKSTGGTGLTANALRTLTLNATPANLVVAAGDRLRIRATVTGTLANTVTFPVYNLTFSVS
jgi:hypothetical protein